MRESIGSVFLYNMIIVFIVITFGFLSASLSYMKAFKVNGKIANSLEKFEGYNRLSDEEITNTLTTIGYRAKQPNCKSRVHNGVSYGPKSALRTKSHDYCIYEYTGKKKAGYFSYGIVTYIYLDIPILGGTFTVPVYSETEPIFKFSL